MKGTSRGVGGTAGKRRRAAREGRAGLTAASATGAEPVAPPPRLSRWLIAATLALSPLLVVPGALDAFRLPQRLAAEWLALASLLPLAWRVQRVDWRSLGRQPALRASLPLLVVALAGLAFTTHPAHVADAVADLGIGVAALAGWSLGLPPASLRRLLDAMLVPATVLAAIAILQIHHLWEPLAFASRLDGERLAITSLAGNPGDLAAFLVLPCLVAQAGIPGASPRGRWWRAAILGICLYALAGSQTLTSLVALAAGSAALWATMLPRRRVLLGFAAAALVTLVLGAAVAPLRDRLVGGWRALHGGGADLNSMLSGRLDGWRVAVRLWDDNPLTGVGLGAYRANFTTGKLRLLHEGVPFYPGHVGSNFVNVHDEYLEVGADLGWPGLFALAWGIAVLWRSYRRGASGRPAADRALAWGGAVAVALLSLAYFPFRLGPVAFCWLAWLAWQLAASGAEETP